MIILSGISCNMISMGVSIFSYISLTERDYKLLKTSIIPFTVNIVFEFIGLFFIIMLIILTTSWGGRNSPGFSSLPFFIIFIIMIFGSILAFHIYILSKIKEVVETNNPYSKLTVSPNAPNITPQYSKTGTPVTFTIGGQQQTIVSSNTTNQYNIQTNQDSISSVNLYNKEKHEEMKKNSNIPEGYIIPHYQPPMSQGYGGSQYQSPVPQEYSNPQYQSPIPQGYGGSQYQPISQGYIVPQYQPNSNIQGQYPIAPVYPIYNNNKNLPQYPPYNNPEVSPSTPSSTQYSPSAPSTNMQ